MTQKLVRPTLTTGAHACLLNNVAEAYKSTRKRNYAWQRNPLKRIRTATTNGCIL